MTSEPVIIVTDFGPVSGLWQAPKAPRACLVLAHGAGAGMTHRSMTAIADGLEAFGVATLRYQFPYMERGSKRVDSPTVAQATVRAAVAEARRRVGTLPLFAGGRSFGGRMTSQAQAAEPLADVRGLVFFAFPLHPAGKPSTARADHLQHVTIPMLFLQGDSDSLADVALLREPVDGLAGRATLHLIDSADHAFHVAARTGRRDDEMLTQGLADVVAWMNAAETCGRAFGSITLSIGKGRRFGPWPERTSSRSPLSSWSRAPRSNRPAAATLWRWPASRTNCIAQAFIFERLRSSAPSASQLFTPRVNFSQYTLRI